jgi:AraC-like DNA-binding protein
MIPAHYYIRATNLLGIEEVLARHGCSIQPLLLEAGIAEDALTRLESLVSYRGFVTLLETAAARHNIPNLGLELVSQNTPAFSNLGPLVLLAKFVATVEEWIVTGLRYWSFHCNAFTLELMKPEGGNTAIFRLKQNKLLESERQTVEGIFGNIVAVLRVVAEIPNANPLVMRFQHARPADISLHASIFRCPVEFGCAHDEIVFDRKYLACPTTGSFKLFKPLMTAYINARVRRMHLYDRKAATTVALAIPSIIGSGNCNIDTVAESLGLNVKALQRALIKEQTSFSDILDLVRENMARHMLVETDASIAAIAGLLDYSTNAPFTNAFQRWTNTSPLRFRKQERQRLALEMQLPVDA